MKLTDEMRASIKAQLTAHPGKTGTSAKASDYKFTPHASDALGVSPSQIPEATAQLRAHGCMVDFDKSGRAIITSERQYKEVAKASGMWNGRDGFGVRDSDDRPVYTGRELQRKRREFREAVLRGEVEL